MHVDGAYVLPLLLFVVIQPRWNSIVVASDQGLSTSEPLILEVTDIVEETQGPSRVTEEEDVDNETKLIKEFLKNSDPIEFNVGGEMMFTSRASLLHVADSSLGQLLLNRSGDNLSVDSDGHVFLDFNPTLFRHLLEQLRLFEAGEAIIFHPPPTPDLTRPFHLMLEKLTLTPVPLADDDVFTLKVPDEIITTQRTMLQSVPDSTLSKFISWSSDKQDEEPTSSQPRLE